MLNIFRNFKTKSKEGIIVLKSHFLLCNTFLGCCIPRFLNKTEISIQKYGHLDIIHTLPTVKNEGMSTDQTIRAKQSLLASTSHSKAPL